MAKDSDSKRHLIYFTARDGMAIMLISILADVPESDTNYYLHSLTEDDGQKCSPLIISSLNGHNALVKMLLNRYKPDVEQEGTVLLDGYVIEGATPLWCAAGTGNLAVVKSVVSYGADVNHPTSTKSTPLRAACFDGHLEIIKYLVEHGADLHMANQYNNSCLMIAAYRGHVNVVSYLLSQNADVNAQTLCGATALHFAAEHGNLSIVKLLLEVHDAKITKTNTGMTALIAAADQTRSHVVEYFISTSFFTEEECMEALELLGASYANDKDHYNLEKAYYYLEMAMKKRCSQGHLYKPKEVLPAILAYDNHTECQTLEELQSIKYDVHALHMESLLIRERILGSDNPEIPHPVIFRGSVFADVGQFTKCINLLLHALQLRHNNQVKVQEDLLRFAQLFSQMLHINEDVPFAGLLQVLSVAADELEKNLYAVRNSAGACSSLVDELESNIHTVLYLFVITTKLTLKFTDEEKHLVYAIVYKINKLHLVTQNASTFLHLAVCTDTPVDDFHTKTICKFPCAATTNMLIQCGADVNAIDNNGNTPLHIIVAYQKPITDFTTLYSIINQLTEAGAHLDCVNNNGETPSEAVLTGVAEIILRTQYKISLKCIAAKAIRQFNISYDCNLPDSLRKFIDMHGVPQRNKLYL